MLNKIFVNILLIYNLWWIILYFVIILREFGDFIFIDILLILKNLSLLKEWELLFDKIVELLYNLYKKLNMIKLRK